MFGTGKSVLWLGSVVLAGACLLAAESKEAGGRPALLKAGQKIVAKKHEITLLRAVRTAESTKAPPAGEGYLVLRFRVKNIHKDEVDCDVSRDLQWLNPADGMRNGPESMTGVKLQNPAERRLAPGAEAEFEAVYMAPSRLSELEFHYVAGYDPVEKARWMIPIQ